MQIQIHTDHNIRHGDQLSEVVENAIQASIGRFSERITSVQVHLSDTNGQKEGVNDKRCLLEARLAGHHPIAVSHEANTLVEAIDGAADKLESSLETTVERRRNH